MTVDTEALIAAVRAGDIEAAQALLPADPIVKRAREICARHMGTPATYLAGEMDGWPAMGGVLEALRTPLTHEQITFAARAVCYAIWEVPEYLSGDADDYPNFIRTREAIHASLRAT